MRRGRGDRIAALQDVGFSRGTVPGAGTRRAARHPAGPTECIRPALSPDARLVAHYWMTPERWTLAITPVAGQMPVWTMPLRPTHTQRVVRWSPDGKAVAFIDGADGTANIWLQEVESASPPRRLTNASEGRMVTFDWSRDGRRLAWTSIREAGGVVMLDLDGRASPRPVR